MNRGRRPHECERLREGPRTVVVTRPGKVVIPTAGITTSAPADCCRPAGQACITPYRFRSRADRPHHHDRTVFVLDPSDGFGTAQQP